MDIQRVEPARIDPWGRQEREGPLPTDYLRYVLGAARRRRFTAALVLVTSLALVVAFWFLQTPLYRAEARILAQRQQAMPSLARSGAPEEPPTRAAWELIHRRENLMELLRASGSLAPRGTERIDVLREAATRASDGLHADDDAQDRLVHRLDRRLRVEAGDLTVAIELDWPDPEQAHRIVEGAVQNFLEARYVLEVTALDEAIAVLRGRAASARAEVEQAAEEARQAASHEAAAQARPRPGAAGRRSRGSEELVRLRSMLDAKARAIGDVEDFRRRRLAELHAQYESRRTVYAEGHPDMASLRLDIAALERESPQVAALRGEELRLRAEYEAQVAAGATPPAGGPDAALRVSPAGAADQGERLREARARHREAVDLVNRAQVELETTRSAFKHRYKVTWPAEVPRRPVSPVAAKVFGLGVAASLLLTLLAVAFLDWRAGRVLERWQLERGLGIPIVGELRHR